MTEPQENKSSRKSSAKKSAADSTASSPKPATPVKVTTTRSRAQKSRPDQDTPAPDEATSRALAAAARNVSSARRKAAAEQPELPFDSEDAWRPGSSQNGRKKTTPKSSDPDSSKPSSARARSKKSGETPDNSSTDTNSSVTTKPSSRKSPAGKSSETSDNPDAKPKPARKPRAAKSEDTGEPAKPAKSPAARSKKPEAEADKSSQSAQRKSKPKLSMDANRMAEIEAKAREAEARAREAEARAKEAEARAKEAEAKARQQNAGGGGGGGGQRSGGGGGGQRGGGGGGGGQQHHSQRGNQQQQKFKNRNRPNKNRNKKKRRKGGGGGGGGDDQQQQYHQRPQRQQSGGGEKQVEYANEEVPQFIEGIVEISGKGFGFLRDPKKNFNQTPSDVFVTPELITKYQLRDGQMLYGETRKGGRGPQLANLLKVNNEDPGKYLNLPNFEELTVLNPMERLALETDPGRYTTRILDLITPIGKGQRGLIVSPPRSGKTTLLQHIAEAITKNYSSMPLIFLLIDERPEEVTELRRAFPNADVMASSNDNDVKTHTRIAQLAIERAKRLVEAGHDVFMLLDSITRMARAFNNASTGGGKTGSGGIDLKAMEIPRRIFASARNTEEAGSLTIIASALIDTGSLMDQYIFQEFKGTGNMDVYLDRRISDQLVFPAIDIFQSGTRREELILPPYMLEKVSTIRRGLAGAKPMEAIQRLIMLVQRFDTNFELLNQIKLSAA